MRFNSIKSLLVAVFFIFGTDAFSQPWSPKSPVPTTYGYEPVSFSIGNKLYVGGGYRGQASDSFFMYDPGTNAWTAKANIPTNIYGAGCFVINNKGYFVSGVSGGSLIASVYMYDAANDTWTQKSNFPGSHRQESAGFSLNNKGYIFGGFTGGSAVSDEMWEYDPFADSWTQKTSCPGGGRNGPASLVINNKAYVGMGASPSGGDTYTDFYEYDPASDTFYQAASIPVSRCAAAHFTLGSFGYIGLGSSALGGSSTLLKDFYKYNPVNDSWTRQSDFGGSARGWVFSETVAGAPYVGGGQDTTGAFRNDNWSYSPTGISFVAPEAAAAIHCYPSPARAEWTIDMIGYGEGIKEVTVYNNMGQTVYATFSDGSIVKIPSGISAGVYTITVVKGQLHSATRVVRL